MSIESVRSKIQSVQAKINSFPSIPQQKFSTVMQEKLGIDLKTSTAATVTQEGLTELQTTTDLTSAVASGLLGNGYNINGNYIGNGSATTYCPQCALESLQGTQNYAINLPAELSGAAPYMQYIQEASERYGMPVNLIIGIMKAESDFNNECVSYAGAKGLMQLMPETAAEVGVTDEFDPRQNILGSVEYVTKLINRYDGDVRLALAAYNTGPGKIQRYGVTSSASQEYTNKVPQSIRDYAERVLKYAGYVN